MKKKTGFLLFSLFCLCSISGFAQQSIRGKVVERQSGQPMAGVLIQTASGKEFYSDSTGNFILAISDKNEQLTFKMVGYIPETIIPDAKISYYTILLRETLSDFKFIDLNEVNVVGYANNRPLSEIPASIGLLQPVDLQRFSNTSLVPAVGTLPGVRMEERSPGSYRLSIRGSTLRSPFGIRNVKVYWNGIPFTDANGNTYLNLLDFNNIGSLEVIKGPGGSLYGAGTGGVVLLNSPRPPGNTNSVSTGSLTGSYGLFGSNSTWQIGNDKLNSTLSLAHQESNGYRDQTRMRRDVLNWQSRFFVSNRRTLSINLLYADLYYQTPGGLTRSQFEQNPQQARPAGGGFPSAAAQQAAILNKTFLLGFSQEYDFNEHWSNTTSLYGAFTNFENPAIRNYERRGEQHFGGRTQTTYETSHNHEVSAKITFGGEFQKGMTYDKNYGNRRGSTDTLQTDDEIPVWNYTAFAQAELDLPARFYLTLGGSYNRTQINFQRFYKPGAARQERAFPAAFLPRIALLNKIADNLSVFGSVGAGFSPPTVAEVLATNGVFNPTLNPEKGTSYELGFRGSLFQGKLKFDVTAYYFKLSETIVIRRAADGSDFYQNAGRTSQKGIESALSYAFIENGQAFISRLKVFFNATYNDYRFENYVVRTSDYSGNWLTGVPAFVSVSGIDLTTKPGFYSNITFNYTERTPLDDANTEFAAGYKLLGGRVGWKKEIFRKLKPDVWIGMDNALDEQYSLGNDLNATGNRFYNPAAGRNFYAGINLKLKI